MRTPKLPLWLPALILLALSACATGPKPSAPLEVQKFFCPVCLSAAETPGLEELSRRASSFPRALVAKNYRGVEAHLWPGIFPDLAGMRVIAGYVAEPDALEADHVCIVAERLTASGCAISSGRSNSPPAWLTIRRT